MNEEYLWDKSGEPDPEIQQLEQVLGTLRYQPKPLRLPNGMLARQRHRYLPLLAIAATLVITFLAGGLWLRMHSKRVPDVRQASLETPNQAPGLPEGVRSKDNSAAVPTDSHRHQNLVGHYVRRKNNTEALSRREREQKEALAAKEQLLMALRLASEKLNLAQRRVQSPALSNQIRNQHKTG
jgi:hypothetical protein